ncbi:hypothetical protein PPYR_02614 [Photinus pyralis]|uniref:Uncharacterized protein n=2 Tax=Photinus pyralis TaxID=7054 RepID=A0A5N4B7V2_PHOPY|nr:uncharacterized protein LOC116159476 [Photinus pyralis]KAB0805644.1 hypothetical protein PPYR_02614 [Photinus pyralis]
MLVVALGKVKRRAFVYKGRTYLKGIVHCWRSALTLFGLLQICTIMRPFLDKARQQQTLFDIPVTADDIAEITNLAMDKYLLLYVLYLITLTILRGPPTSSFLTSVCVILTLYGLGLLILNWFMHHQVGHIFASLLGILVVQVMILIDYCLLQIIG